MSNSGKSGWDFLGSMINTYFIIKAIPFIIIIVVIFYGVGAIKTYNNNAKADENYISSSDYSKYVIDIANSHVINNTELSFDAEKSLANSDINMVALYYTFTGTKDYDKYEKLAYDELFYVYHSIKDTKIKKEKIAYPDGEDLYFSFNIDENGKKTQIGAVHALYYFGKLQADDYLDKTEKIIKLKP